MLRWLKRKIRSWLLDDDKPPDPILLVDVGAGQEKACAMGVAGIHLVCKSQSSEDGQMLVRSDQAVDPKHFWRVWQHLGGSRLTWASGKPFKPPID